MFDSSKVKVVLDGLMVSTERMAQELARHLQGWIGYLEKCGTPSALQGVEE